MGDRLGTPKGAVSFSFSHSQPRLASYRCSIGFFVVPYGGFLSSRFRCFSVLVSGMLNALQANFPYAFFGAAGEGEDFFRSRALRS